MQTGVSNLEQGDLTPVSLPQMEEDYEREDSEELGSWKVAIGGGNLSCQDAR